MNSRYIIQSRLFDSSISNSYSSSSNFQTAPTSLQRVRSLQNLILPPTTYRIWDTTSSSNFQSNFRRIKSNKLNRIFQIFFSILEQISSNIASDTNNFLSREFNAPSLPTTSSQFSIERNVRNNLRILFEN